MIRRVVQRMDFTNIGVHGVFARDGIPDASAGTESKFFRMGIPPMRPRGIATQVRLSRSMIPRALNNLRPIWGARPIAHRRVLGPIGNHGGPNAGHVRHMLQQVLHQPATGGHFVRAGRMTTRTNHDQNVRVSRTGRRHDRGRECQRAQSLHRSQQQGAPGE